MNDRDELIATHKEEMEHLKYNLDEMSNRYQSLKQEKDSLMSGSSDEIDAIRNQLTSVMAERDQLKSAAQVETVEPQWIEEPIQEVMVEESVQLAAAPAMQHAVPPSQERVKASKVRKAAIFFLHLMHPLS